MGEDAIGRVVVDAAIKVHRTLGPGLLESVYEAALALELTQRGHSVERQKALPVVYEGTDLGLGFRIDLLVDAKVLVELKSVDRMQQVFNKQTLSYLRLADLRLGYLINFNTTLLKDGITRIVNDLTNAQYDKTKTPSRPPSRPPRPSRDTPA